MIVALAGGVGAARFLRGLVKLVKPEELKIIVNTGDDEEFYGLHVSPDLDIVIYTLAGCVDEERGWGFGGDTYNAQGILARLGCETWFRLGDKDLGVHIYRTWRLRQGARLSEVTREIARSLGVEHEIIPMTDDYFRTFVKTVKGEILPFQRYFVQLGASEDITAIEYRGVESAKPSEGVLKAISRASYIIICPSNPFVSIGTILALRGVRDAVRKSTAKKLAISPIIGGKTIKGPADRMMKNLGYEVSPYGIAKIYKDIIDIMVIDKQDEYLNEKIEKELEVKTYCTNTIMKTEKDSIELARFCLRILEENR